MARHRILPAVLVLLALGLPAFKQADSPLAGSRSFRLGNGLTILCREQRDVPLVAIDLWILAGSGHERPNESGAAHFLEHMLFKGTAKRGPGEIDMAFEDSGSQLFAGTTRDAVHYHATVAQAALPQSLEALADIVQHAALDEKEIERERTVIIDEAATRRNDWARAASDALHAAAFPDSAIGRPIVGDSQSILTLRRESIEGFYRRNYRPAGAALAIVGSIDPESARKAAESAFKDWAASPLELASGAAVPKLPASGKFDSGGSGSVAGIGAPLPPSAPIEQHHSSSICAAIVGDPRYGRIAESLKGIDKSAIAAAESAPGRTGGLLMFFAKSSTLSPEALRKHIEIELDRIVKEGVTEDEVEWARRRMIGGYLFETETFAGQARLLGLRQLAGGYLSAVNYIDSVRGVSAERVNEFIRDTVGADRRVSVIGTSR